MSKMFTTKVSITLNKPAKKVWEALTKPELIKQYMFGTEAISDWKVGSPIIYKGVWEGKAYEDKGKILELVPEKLLKSSYWSALSGKEDKPENYEIVTYLLAESNDKTELKIMQESPEKSDKAEENWSMVLDGLKKVVEEE